MGPVLVILVPGGDEIIKIRNFFEEKRVLEVVEAIEISEAAKVNEAA